MKIRRNCSVCLFALAVFPSTSLAFTTSRHSLLSPTRTPPSSRDQHPVLQRTIRREKGRFEYQASGPLQASSLSSTFGSPLGAIGVLFTVILVHECGHYFAAKAFGIKVEEFSIGVGPRIGGFKAFGNEFNLRALPLGGYVRFPENYDSQETRVKERDAMKKVDEFLDEELPTPRDKVLNALSLGSIGENKIKEENERRKAAQKQTFLQRIFRPKKGVEPLIAPDDVAIEYYDDPQLLQNRPWPERVTVLSAGVIFNFILSFTLFFALTLGPGLPSREINPGSQVTGLVSNDAPAKGFLRNGDVIIGINELDFTAQKSVAARSKSVDLLVKGIQSTPDGEDVRLTVLHPGDSKPQDVRIQPKKNSSGQQSIGVFLSPNVNSRGLKANSLPEAVSYSSRVLGDSITEIAGGFLKLISEAASGKAAASGAGITGPIGLISTGSEIVATQNLASIFVFMALISVNLGVVNAFPIPALDGGQLVFVLLEAVTGRKINQRLQESITGAMLIILLYVTVSASLGDVSRIFLR